MNTVFWWPWVSECYLVCVDQHCYEDMIRDGKDSWEIYWRRTLNPKAFLVERKLWFSKTLLWEYRTDLILSLSYVTALLKYPHAVQFTIYSDFLNNRRVVQLQPSPQLVYTLEGNLPHLQWLLISCSLRQPLSHCLQTVDSCSGHILWWVCALFTFVCDRPIWELTGILQGSCREDLTCKEMHSLRYTKGWTPTHTHWGRSTST